MYRIRILPSAEKDLDEFPAKIFNQIRNKIFQLKENPRLHGAIKLTSEGAYRMRVGDYRLLYRIDDTAKVIFIYRVKHRKEAYR